MSWFSGHVPEGFDRSDGNSGLVFVGKGHTLHIPGSSYLDARYAPSHYGRISPDLHCGCLVNIQHQICDPNGAVGRVGACSTQVGLAVEPLDLRPPEVTAQG